jgi:hypothetical protein
MLHSSAPLPARPPRATGAGLLLVLFALVLTACTGATAAPSGVASLDDPATSDAPGASDGPASSMTPEDAMLAFAKCMREHGVDMPDPQPGGQGGVVFNIDRNGIDSETFQEAQEACGDIMQDAGFGPGRSMSPEDQDKLVAFAACMREHGIDMPDPQTTSGGGGGAVRIGGDGIDPGSPEFQDAMEACQALMPGGGPGGDGGPSVNQSGG